MIPDAAKKQTIEKLVGSGSRYFGKTWRLVGKAGTVIGITVTIYSVAKNYVELTKNDPDAKEIFKLDKEYQKWVSAISCIGRDIYHIGDICTWDKGGAINELGEKLSVSALSTRYGDGSKNVFNPAPDKVKELINRAIDKVSDSYNPLGIENFQEIKEDIIKRFRAVDKALAPEYDPDFDYTKYQIELSGITRKMVSIEREYNLEISRLVSKLNWKKPGFAGKAVWKGTAGELVDIIKIVIKGKKK